MRLALLWLTIPLLAARAQTADFLERARAATQALRDPEAARAAGYRAVGPDFPGMGQHWIHTTLILRSTPDVAQPPVLEYAELNGKLTLVGVAYAVLVNADTAPASIPVPASAWHFHQGTVEEESFLRSHAGGGVSHDMHGSTGGGPRLAVLHAWIWLDNPDGILATDNWALPYARLGLAVPPAISHPAARALALASGDGGRHYLEALVHAVGQPSEEEMQALRVVIARHQAGARDEAPSVTKLEACWRALWDDVKRAVRPEVWERLAPIS